MTVYLLHGQHVGREGTDRSAQIRLPHLAVERRTVQQVGGYHPQPGHAAQPTTPRLPVPAASGPVPRLAFGPVSRRGEWRIRKTFAAMTTESLPDNRDVMIVDGVAAWGG
jgi:hypothetical protein